MKFPQLKFLLKGGPVAKKDSKVSDSKVVKSVERRSPFNPTALWVGATVAFAVLFFLSAILDMRVKVTFGSQTAVQSATGIVNTSYIPVTTTPTSAAPASGGIASQVGGC